MSESPHHERHRDKESQSPRNNTNGDRHSSERRERRGGSRDRNGADKRDKGDDDFTQVYIAKLSRRTSERDLSEAFSQYGKIKDIVLKHSYAFIEYEEHQAAVEAVKEMNGKNF